MMSAFASTFQRLSYPQEGYVSDPLIATCPTLGIEAKGERRVRRYKPFIQRT